MASLDNLVVSTALPVIRVHLHTGLSGSGVDGERLHPDLRRAPARARPPSGSDSGRRRVFVAGIALFTVASAVAALAPSIGVLVAARAVQGAGGAMIMPLSLTLLSQAVRPERRAAALGAWGAIGGLAVAIGPLGRRRRHDGLVVAVHLLAERADRDRAGAPGPLEAVGVAQPWPPRSTSGACSWSALGLFGMVYGLVQGNSHGWTSTGVLSSFAARRRRPGRLRVVGAAHRRADAAAAPLQATGLRRRQRDGDAVQLRHVRRHLLPVAVPPDRAGLLAARARASGSCPGRA